MRSAVIFFIALCVALSLYGQTPSIINYSVTEGLPSLEVYNIHQDKKGFIWFATDNGVTRFDGTEFTVFQAKDGLTDPVVFGLFEDVRGRIWFRTFSGKLSYYEDGLIKPYKFNDTLRPYIQRGVMSGLYVNENNELWCTVRKSAMKIDSMGVLTRLPTVGEGLYVLDVDGNHLLGNSNMYYPIKEIIIDNRRFPINLKSPYQESPLECTITWKGKQYFSINNQIFSYDKNKIELAHNTSAPIISLSKDREDKLWVGYLNTGSESFTENYCGTRSCLWWIRRYRIPKETQ